MSDGGSRLVRYRADAAGAILAVCTVGAMVSGALGLIPLWTLPFLVVALRWNGLVQHNHSHLPLFRVAPLNRAFDVVVSFVSAVPHPLYRHIHLDIHHRYEHRPEDWTGPFSYAGTVYPDRPVPLWRYLAVFTVRGWRRGIPPVWHDAKTRRDLLVCTMPMVASCAVLGVLDPVGTALFVGFPWVATSVFLPLSNWLQHDGCTYDCTATVGNLNRGAFSQGIGFNIGFHAAHHARPAAHWSKLPALHERLVAADVPVAMIRGGLVSDLRRAGTRCVRVT